jgi:hypothetical protein
MALPLPQPVKRSLGRAIGHVTRQSVVRELRALARGSEPIVTGPWLGEVGFELLYWVPFLAWVAAEFDVAPDRLVVLSRGGTSDWYRHLATRYRDVLERLSPEEFRRRNDERIAEQGEQKQGAMTSVDRQLLAPVLRELGADERRVLHPSLMYRLFRPYWFGHAGIEWVGAHTRYTQFPSPAGMASLDRLPSVYTAVKFYYNDSFPATPRNRLVARDVLADLTARGPVVSLSTGLAIDDHEAWEEEATLAAHGIRADLSPATNLALQGAIVARAAAWVGTYGGFAYLAPFFGVPSTAYYSKRAAFSARHLALAEHVFRTWGSPSAAAEAMADRSGVPLTGSTTPLLTLRDAG